MTILRTKVDETEIRNWMECRWEHKVGCVREIELISGGFSQHQKGIFDDISMGVLPLLMGHSEEVIGGWKPLV